MAVDCGLGPGDRSLVAYPFFHVSGLEAPGSFAALSAGVTCIVDDVADAATTLATLVEERITCQVMLPPLYDEVVTLVRESGTDLPHLRWLLTGGVTPALMDTFVATFPGKRLIEVFAMTEATGPLTLLDEAHMVEKAGRTGKAVLDVELRIVDEHSHPLPPDTMGVLQARSPKISVGYWGDGDPDRPDGWFDTGDLATLDADGYLAYRGRAKEMLKSGGENVAMAEIERVLTQHPAIKAACIVRLPDPRWGEVPKAYVLLREGMTASADELETFCRASLAGYKVPKVWQFEDDLPFNHSGKVLRRVLQAREDDALAAVAR
jgi:acyl-CoA synthetase (AMP-forming)/AMP-acid ligase II